MIATFTLQANDIRSSSTDEHKFALRHGKILFVNSYIEVLEQKASPNAASTSVNAADVQFSDADFSAYAVEGPATLEGEAFIRTRGGELIYCAGETVFLAPATQYDLNVIKAFGFGRDVAMKRAGPAAKYWQETVCDSQGKFTFENLPFGTWVVITDVRYTVSRGRSMGISAEQQGGLMAKRVTVRNKKSKVIMNEQSLRSNSVFGVDWPN